ncbi:MAG: hypothetical protein K6A35_08220 [bacterium]|nr:hypothetical protein [bacterium]
MSPNESCPNFSKQADPEASDPSPEELEALFSGPALDGACVPLAESSAEVHQLEDIDVDELLSHLKELSGRPTGNGLAYDGSSSLNTAANAELKADIATVFAKNIGVAAENSSKKSLSRSLASMARSAGDIAARNSEALNRQSGSSVLRLTNGPGIPISDVQAEAVPDAFPLKDDTYGVAPQEVAKETAEELDPNSPEALRERIKAYQAQNKPAGMAMHAVGMVFAFGFTIATVIVFFWWLGQKISIYTGLEWPKYACIFLGVIIGLYSGGLLLMPFMKEPKQKKNSL